MTNIEYAKWLVFQDMDSAEVTDGFVWDLIETMGFNGAVSSLALSRITKMETEPDRISHGDTSLSWSNKTGKINALKDIFAKAEKGQFTPPEPEVSDTNFNLGDVNTK